MFLVISNLALHYINRTEHWSKIDDEGKMAGFGGGKLNGIDHMYFCILLNRIQITPMCRYLLDFLYYWALTNTCEFRKTHSRAFMYVGISVCRQPKPTNYI